MPEESNSEPQVSGHGASSRWTFNWTGLVALVIIASLTVVAWQWLDGSDDDGGQLSIDATTAPNVSTETTTPRTDPPATTVPPTTTTTQPPTTTTVVSEKRVLIRGEMKPCRYGANCLVASFSIEGFDEHPGRFTCVYPNSRPDFSFNSNDVEEACLTADAGDTITIVVDGIESATISEENLDGT